MKNLSKITFKIILNFSMKLYKITITAKENIWFSVLIMLCVSTKVF